MADDAAASRRMKYPYTLSAKLSQFPFKFYFNRPNTWVFKYWVFAAVVCIPVFYKIQKLSFSPENVKKWDEIHEREFSGVAHH
ncbi:reduction of Rh1 [Halictus rubicundus]|uniref:reduction of Rh1 n=1 Tax=Halictus rubicundus TaxID=77578 RepID=UPI004035AAB6